MNSCQVMALAGTEFSSRGPLCSVGPLHPMALCLDFPPNSHCYTVHSPRCPSPQSQLHFSGPVPAVFGAFLGSSGAGGDSTETQLWVGVRSCRGVEVTTQLASAVCHLSGRDSAISCSHDPCALSSTHRSRRQPPSGLGSDQNWP